MRVLNKTLYDSKALRRIFLYAMKKVGIEDSPKRIWHVSYAKRSSKVVTKYAKQFRVTGAAARGFLNRRGNISVGNVIWIRLSPHGATNGTYLTQVVIHELQHNLGRNHTNMVGCIHIDVSDLPKDLKLLHEQHNRKEATNGVQVVRVRMREVWEEREIRSGETG